MSPSSEELSSSSHSHVPNGTILTSQRAHYEPPWSNTSIIGIAGSSGSGKTSLSLAIIRELSLPWVVLMSMDSFYKPLSGKESEAAFRNEYDFDAPDAIDFDVLVERLNDIKSGKKADIPVYSFEKHNRLDHTTTIYSPHVLILEGIFALHDQRVLDLLDLKIFAEADSDLCLSRRREIVQPSSFNVRKKLTLMASKSSATSVNEDEISKDASSNGLDSSNRTSTDMSNRKEMLQVSRAVSLYEFQQSRTTMMTSNSKHSSTENH